MRRLLRLLSRLALVLIALALVAIVAAWWTLRSSLPALDGDLAVPGLSAPVRIERDALGTVTIDAANEADAARALGWVHGQERFFEMDLLRRSAAGELSELFGAIAIERDKALRIHRMRARVDESLAKVAGARMPVLQAYADGVNAGRQALATRPWPYLLLRAEPEDWRPSDSLLAGYAMFFDLQDESNSRELALWKIRNAVPPALYTLLAADGTQWDAPLIGEPRGNIALPTAAQLDLRKLPTPEREGDVAEAEPAAPGSNNFAVAGSLTADNRAIVADDMHLGLRAPNLWFRARMRYADAHATGGRVDVSGVNLPGIPAIVVGSNTHVAWGFTNSYGDWADWIRVPDCNPACTHTVTETIKVKGGKSVTLAVELYGWNESPVTARDIDGRKLALAWVAHMPGALDLNLADLARARDVEDALRIGQGSGMPQQNLVVGDAAGHIGWTITGHRPVRVAGCDPMAPVDGDAGAFAVRASEATPVDRTLSPAPLPGGEGNLVAAAQRTECLAFARYDSYPAPLLASPVVDRLWTANARVLDGDPLMREGDAGYANGARAKQIRDDLLAKTRFTEADLLAIQVDDRAVFLERWWKLLRERAQATGAAAPWTKIASATATWEGRAAPGSTSYRIVRAWRLAVLERIKTGLTAPAAAKLGEEFVMPDLPQIEGVGWELVTQRPAHLLPRKYGSWDALFDDAAAEVGDALEEHPGPLAQRTWGERNTAA
ncbi:MAG: penicillin acylase family protein, partial [Arenimonas sp.]